MINRKSPSISSAVNKETEMAAMQREMVIATDEGIAVIKKQVIIDPESGLAVEVENAKIAVDVGGGNVLVQEQQRVRGVHIPSAAVSD